MSPKEPNNKSGCTNEAKLISETVPDHTVVDPGSQGIKSWTIKNTGTCTWTIDYFYRYTQGNKQMGPETFSIFDLGVGRADPGQLVTLSFMYLAPDDPGSYTNRYEIFDPEGNSFIWLSLVVDVVKQGGSPQGAIVATIFAPSVVQKCEGFEVRFAGFDPNDEIEFGYKLLSDPNPIPNLGTEYANAKGETAIWIDSLAVRGQYVVRGLSGRYEASAVFIVEGENDCPCGEVCIEF